jgi:hypothetical protein
MVTNSFIKRNFLNQTGDFNTTWRISANNLTGSGSFGLSGVGQNYSFTIKSGEIYDPYNKLLGSYQVNIPFTLQNDITNSKDSLYYNESPKFLFKTNDFFTDHNYNYFFVNPSGLDIDFDFFIKGEATTLQISTLNRRSKNDNTNVIVNTITGKIVNTNSNLNVKIFDGNILDAPQYTLSGFPLSFNDTGYFYINSDSGTNKFLNNNLNLGMVLNTNFGQSNFNLNIVNEYIPFRFSSLSLSPSGDMSIAQDQTLNVLAQYGTDSGSFLNIKLEYISGSTGFFTGYLPGTGYVTDTIYGIITGSGYIEKILNYPILLTGYNAFKSGYDYSEATNIKITGFAYATGDVIFNYSVTGTGLGTGFAYLDIPSSGNINVHLSGYVPYVGGGLLSYTTGNFITTGYSVDQSNDPITITGYSSQVTNFINVKYTGDITGVFLESGQYKSKLFSGYHTSSYAGQKITSDPYYLLATGYATGYNKTGIVDADFFRFFEGGNYFFIKNATGISGYSLISDSENVITGLSGLLNCKTADPIKYSGIALMSGINKFNLFVDECDENPIFFYFLATGKAIGEINLYSALDNKVVDADILKFLIIGASGSNKNKFANLENLNYLTGNAYGTGIRTRISHLGNTISGSGYFSGIFSEGSCENLGIWEHNFIDFTITTGLYLTNNYISSFESKIISSEENISSNFNSIKFTIL